LTAVTRIKEAFEDSEQDLGLFVRYLDEAHKKLRPLSKAKVVLLTGATGFLGAHVLVDLLQRTSAKVICLIRDKQDSVTAAEQTLRDALAKWRISSPPDAHKRIQVIVGDLNVPHQFGLSNETWHTLADTVVWTNPTNQPTE